jgi:hypothetical protein
METYDRIAGRESSPLLGRRGILFCLMCLTLSDLCFGKKEENGG